MAGPSELTKRKQKLQILMPGYFPIILIEKFQNWGMTQTMDVLSVRPKSVKEVENLIIAMTKYNRLYPDEPLSMRCVGDAHSWSPLFPDEGNILMYTSELVMAGGKRICLNEPSSKSEPITVTLVPGVTTGELSQFFTKNNVCLKSDVILDKVTYGGVIATGCHGVGKDQKSVSDFVSGMSIVGADGQEKNYDSTNTTREKLNALKCNLGLFGVMTGITMVVEPMVLVQTDNEFEKYTVGNLFYNPKELQTLHDENWSVEIFWFPFNSLTWCELMLLGILKDKIGRCPILAEILKPLAPCWDPKEDKLWVRKIKITEVPAEVPAEVLSPSKVDYDIRDLKGLASTAFGRILSKHLIEHPGLIPSFLKVGFDMVKRFNTGTMLEPINKAIHYQSFIELMPVVDMEFAFNASPGTFSDQALAMQKAVKKCEVYYHRLEFPLSVAMEMRWIAYSDCPICPARAVQTESESGETLYLEVLGIAGQPEWESFTKEVADEWMAMTVNGKAPVPHWAKQWSYLTDIDHHIQEAYGEKLKEFTKYVSPEERVLFSNTTLNKAIFKPAQKTIPRKETRSNKQPILPSKARLTRKEEGSLEGLHAKTLEKINGTLCKHEESWKMFFKTLGEQVWNVPNLVPMMNIQREWEFASAILNELGAELKKNPDLSVQDTLYRDFFQ